MVLWSSNNREKTHVNYDVTLIGNSKKQKFLWFELIAYSICFFKCGPFIIFQAYIIRLHTAAEFLHQDTRTFIFIIRWIKCRFNYYANICRIIFQNFLDLKFNWHANWLKYNKSIVLIRSTKDVLVKCRWPAFMKCVNIFIRLKCQLMM